MAEVTVCNSVALAAAAVSLQVVLAVPVGSLTEVDSLVMLLATHAALDVSPEYKQRLVLASSTSSPNEASVTGS